MLRRTKDILEEKLPLRIRAFELIEANPSELWIYILFESKFLNALKAFTAEMEDTGNPIARKRMKEAFEIMMACMSLSRMSLIHPVIPKGRELTIQFSPSRKHLLKRQERPKICVFCDGDPSQMEKKEIEIDTDSDSESDSDTDDDSYHDNLHSNHHSNKKSIGTSRRVRTTLDLDDDELDDEDDLGVILESESNDVDKKKGPIIPLGSDICHVTESVCRHFAHEKW